MVQSGFGWLQELVSAGSGYSCGWLLVGHGWWWLIADNRGWIWWIVINW